MFLTFPSLSLSVSFYLPTLPSPLLFLPQISRGISQLDEWRRSPCLRYHLGGPRHHRGGDGNRVPYQQMEEEGQLQERGSAREVL